MTREDLIISLQKIVKPYVQDQNAFNNLSEETDFINDLKINSANLVDVILDVEELLSGPSIKAVVHVRAKTTRDPG